MSLFIFMVSFFIITCTVSKDTESPPRSGIPEGVRVSITIDPSEEACILDERYIGYAFDTAQFTGGKWWVIGQIERAEAETPDLENPKLRRLVSYLAPSIMRIGGTDCDGAYFYPSEDNCELPDSSIRTFEFGTCEKVI